MILETRLVHVTLEPKMHVLRNILRECNSILVAFSGGVDSSFLLKVAHDTLGNRALGAIADSPSLPRRELREALDLASRIGSPVEVVETREVDQEAYQANRPDRCYHCKAELFDCLAKLASERGFAVVAYGANTDDLRDVRPGARAAREHGVRAPLVEAGLTKDEIRQLSRSLGLPTWDKPSFACLSSRVPYGTPVSADLLARIEAAEDVLYRAGFRQFRVRHHDTIARLELGQDEMDRLFEPALRDKLVSELTALGYGYVTLDLAGYRTGSMNEALRRIPLRVVST